MTYSKKDNSSTFIVNYMKRELQLGVMCLKSSFHIADKIDVMSMMK